MFPSLTPSQSPDTLHVSKLPETLCKYVSLSHAPGTTFLHSTLFCCSPGDPGPLHVLSRASSPELGPRSAAVAQTGHGFVILLPRVPESQDNGTVLLSCDLVQ